MYYNFIGSREHQNMIKLIEEIMDKMPCDVLTDDTLKHLVKGSTDCRYSLVKRAVAKGDLIHLRRGLYVLAKKYQRRGTNLYELAQKIYGPSYVSFESALAHHGWIPEAVYTVTSACTKRSREFHTPLGVFAYTRVPAHPFYTGVERVESPDGICFMANPWKALTDYVYANKKDWKNIDPLIKDLRIEGEYLKNVEGRFLDELQESYKSSRVEKFICGVKKELK